MNGFQSHKKIVDIMMDLVIGISLQEGTIQQVASGLKAVEADITQLEEFG